MFQLLYKFVIGVAALLPLASCDGIFNDIYHKPSMVAEQSYGFIQADESAGECKIYVNATEYNRWIYIDLHNKRIDSLIANSATEQPAEWDFAVHRYDTKTNGGAVAETEFENLNDILKAQKEFSDYFEDIWTESKISVDMSQMMQGIIVYDKSFYNPQLSKWVDVSTATMPPTYTPSNKVYVLKMKDGTKAALKLSGFTNSEGVKGWLTINYIYPLNIL